MAEQDGWRILIVLCAHAHTHFVDVGLPHRGNALVGLSLLCWVAQPAPQTRGRWTKPSAGCAGPARHPPALLRNGLEPGQRLQRRGGPAFNQQTLRQIVHTSIAASVARVQFSNAFGTQPLQLSDVHIAQRMSGSSVTPGADRGVTFGAQTETSVAAGDVAISDPIAFPVSALSDVAISVYLPQPTGPTTYHQQGTQTNYIASGDVSADANLTGAQAAASYYLLANLDVQGLSSPGAVVTLGASITDGFASAQDGNHRWPNYLAIRLADAELSIGVLNQGINGNRLLMDGAGQSALHRFDRDVLSQPGVAWLIFSDDPINDLGSTVPAPTTDQLVAGVAQLIASAHESHLKFLCSTLTPFQGASYWTQDGETGREGFNAFVRGPNSGCDGIVDQDVATHDPENPARFLPAYDSGDHLHPNDAGRQAIANAVDLSLFSTRALSQGDDAGSDSMNATGGARLDGSKDDVGGDSSAALVSAALASDAGTEAASYTSDAEPSSANAMAGEGLTAEGGAWAGRPDAGATSDSVDRVSDAGEPKTTGTFRSVGCSAVGVSSQGPSWGLALVVLGTVSARVLRHCPRRAARRGRLGVRANCSRSGKN